MTTLIIVFMLIIVVLIFNEYSFKNKIASAKADLVMNTKEDNIKILKQQRNQNRAIVVFAILTSIFAIWWAENHNSVPRCHSDQDCQAMEQAAAENHYR